jgi:Flp pilus assembly protein TadG
MIDRLIDFTAKHSKGFLRNVTGVAGIEAAFILPVMLIIYFGLLDLTTVRPTDG